MGRRRGGGCGGPCFPFWKKRILFQVKVLDRMFVDHLGFPPSLRAQCPSLQRAPRSEPTAFRASIPVAPRPRQARVRTHFSPSAVLKPEAPGGLELRLPGMAAGLRGHCTRSGPRARFPCGAAPGVGGGRLSDRSPTGLRSRGLPWSFPSRLYNWLKLLLHTGRFW